MAFQTPPASPLVRRSKTDFLFLKWARPPTVTPNPDGEGRLSWPAVLVQVLLTRGRPSFTHWASSHREAGRAGIRGGSICRCYLFQGETQVRSSMRDPGQDPGGAELCVPGGPESPCRPSLRAGSAGFGDGRGEVLVHWVAWWSSWVGWDLAERLAWAAPSRR